MLTTKSDAIARPSLALLLAAGFAAGVAQVLLMRELLVLSYGNELSMGLLLACWLLAGALGSIIGRRLARRCNVSGIATRAVWSCVLPAPALIAGVAVARVAPLLMAHVADFTLARPATAPVLGWLALRPGEMPGLGQLALIGALAALGPAALDGVQFALGSALYLTDRQRGAGVAYAADAIGHLVGGVLLATAVVLLLDPMTMALVPAAVSLVPALWLMSRVIGIRRPALAGAAMGVLTCLGLLALATGPLHHASLRWRWHSRELLVSVESIYGNLALTRQEPDGIFLHQNGLYAGASPPLPGTIDELVHFVMLQVEHPDRVLMLGGGMTGGVREVLKHGPQHVTCVELDPTLFALAERWAAPEDLAALRDPRVHTLAMDGRRYLNVAPAESFDVVIIALPDPATAQINRLYTAEFYAAARSAVGPRGVVGWSIPGSEGYFGPALLRLHRCLLATAAKAAERIVALPGETTVCAAGGPGLTDDPTGLLQRLAARGIDAPYFAAMLPERLSDATRQAVAQALATDAPAEINRDLRPIGYFLDQTWWLTQFHPASARLLEGLSRLRLGGLVVPVGVACAVLLGLGWFPAVRARFVTIGVAASGMVSISLEVVVLLAFQVIYGYLYHMVGAIIGAFMVGVAAGSLAANRRLTARDARHSARDLALAQVALALMALGLGALLPSMSRANLGATAPVLFPLLTAFIGATVGVIFPVAAAAAGGDAARVPAGLYAADLTGAAIGAVAVGAFLAPVLGLPGTCWLGAAIAAAAAVLAAARTVTTT